MQIKTNQIPTKRRIFYFGQLSFYMGGFFLASALPISIIFFLFAIFVSTYLYKFSIHKDNWNMTLFISALLMIISTTKAYFIEFPVSIEENKAEIWLNLFNWIPLFILFSKIRIYLRNINDRKNFLIFLLIGTLPVIVSCISQKWFNFYGPHETMQGLVVWFNKELFEGDGISGLFSNQNYTGFWLSTMFPLSMGVFLSKKRSILKNSCILSFIICIFYLTLLTYSRNAIIGLFSSISLIIGLKLILTIIIIPLIILLLFYLINTTYLRLILNFIETILPLNIIIKFIKFDLVNINKWTRLEIWEEAIKLIISRPLLGFAAVPFSLFFISKHNFGHIHNMPLQLAFDYGLPLSLLLSGFVVILLIKSWYRVMPRDPNNTCSKGVIIDKCWFAASIVAVFSHINDISYYDGKISILIWILLAGLVCINDQIEVCK